MAFEEFRGQEEIPISEPEDLISSPSHYQLPIQPIDFIIKNWPEGYKAHVIPYVVRAGKKLYPGMDEGQSEVKDLQKAIEWCQRRVEYLLENTDEV